MVGGHRKAQIGAKNTHIPHEGAQRLSEAAYMSQTHENIVIDVKGIFATQVRQMAQMMGITHEAVIQMAIAGFAASPIAASIPCRAVEGKNSLRLPSLKSPKRKSNIPEIIIAAKVNR